MRLLMAGLWWRLLFVALALASGVGRGVAHASEEDFKSMERRVAELQRELERVRAAQQPAATAGGGSCEGGECAPPPPASQPPPSTPASVAKPPPPSPPPPPVPAAAAAPRPIAVYELEDAGASNDHLLQALGESGAHGDASRGETLRDAALVSLTLRRGRGGKADKGGRDARVTVVALSFAHREGRVVRFVSAAPPHAELGAVDDMLLMQSAGLDASAPFPLFALAGGGAAGDAPLLLAASATQGVVAYSLSLHADGETRAAAESGEGEGATASAVHARVHVSASVVASFPPVAAGGGGGVLRVTALSGTVKRRHPVAVVGYGDGSLRFYHGQNATARHVLQSKGALVTALSAPAGELVAFASDQSVGVVHATRSGSPLVIECSLGQRGARGVRALAFERDSQHMFVLSGEGALLVLNTRLRRKEADGLCTIAHATEPLSDAPLTMATLPGYVLLASPSQITAYNYSYSHLHLRMTPFASRKLPTQSGGAWMVRALREGEGQGRTQTLALAGAGGLVTLRAMLPIAEETNYMAMLRLPLILFAAGGVVLYRFCLRSRAGDPARRARAALLAEKMAGGERRGGRGRSGAATVAEELERLEREFPGVRERVQRAQDASGSVEDDVLRRVLPTPGGSGLGDEDDDVKGAPEEDPETRKLHARWSAAAAAERRHAELFDRFDAPHDLFHTADDDSFSPVEATSPTPVGGGAASDVD